MAIENTSPKERFIKSKGRVEAHRSIVSHAQFENSVDVALLQYAHELGDTDDAGKSTQNFYRLAGAQRFVRVLKNLSEQLEPVKQVRTGNLDHTI